METKLVKLRDVANRLGVAQVTVRSWIAKGLFPNAERIETERGPVWKIAETDLAHFQPPTMGRPKKSKGTQPA